MTQLYKLFAPLLSALLLAGAVAGCGGDRNGRGSTEDVEIPSDPVAGGTLVIGYPSDLPGVNEAIVTSSQATDEILYRMFLHLLDEQPDYQERPPTFKPRLAESYEFSEDHKSLTFHLRPGVLWSDGEPITAEDVRWTWEAQTHPKIAWDGVSMKKTIVGVEVIDPLTVRFDFTHSYPGQLVHANEGGILPKHAWSKLPFEEWRGNGQWFVDNLVVSGPYVLDSLKPQQEVVLRRNERYYEEGLPYIDRVVLKVVPDTQNQLAQLFSGGLDLMRQVPAASAKDVDAHPDTRLITFWPPQFGTVIWNLRNPIFLEPEVRRALALGLDRKAIVETIWYGQALPADSPIISTVWGHNDELKPLPYDPEAARQLLAKHGWEDRDGDGVVDREGKELAFELSTHPGNQERIDAAVMIQDQLRRIGVKVIPRILEWNRLDQIMTNGEFDAIIMGLGLETSLDVSAYFHSSSIGSELNFGAYSNPLVDELLVDIRSRLNPEDALPSLYRLQEILQQEQPQTLLWESKRLVGVRRRVHDASPSPIGTLDGLRNWWLYPQNS